MPAYVINVVYGNPLTYSTSTANSDMMADNINVTIVDFVLQMIGFVNEGERNGIMTA